MTNKDVPPFEREWLEAKILMSGQFDALNDEATLIVYAIALSYGADTDSTVRAGTDLIPCA